MNMSKLYRIYPSKLGDVTTNTVVEINNNFDSSISKLQCSQGIVSKLKLITRTSIFSLRKFGILWRRSNIKRGLCWKNSLREKTLRVVYNLSWSTNEICGLYITWSWTCFKQGGLEIRMYGDIILYKSTITQISQFITFNLCKVMENLAMKTWRCRDKVMRMTQEINANSSWVISCKWSQNHGSFRQHRMCCLKLPWINELGENQCWNPWKCWGITHSFITWIGVCSVWVIDLRNSLRILYR